MRNSFLRILFFLPWSDDTAILGTTEARQESPDTAEISGEERAELVAAHARWFKIPLDDQDIVGAYSGLRPLVRSDGGTSAASREAVIGTPGGVVTLYGGKWTTSRLLGMKAADQAERLLRR